MESEAPPIPAVPLPNFTPENLRELEAARRSARKIRRVVSVANFDGWTIAIFGAITLAMGLTDITNILLSLGLGAVAYIELRSAARVKRLQADAARILSINQLALAGILIIYACSRLYMVSGSGGTAAALGISDPDVLQMYGNMQAQAQSMLQSIVHAFYVLLIVIAVFAQGSMALYYFTRIRLIHNYVAKTPQWIVKLQEAGFAM